MLLARGSARSFLGSRARGRASTAAHSRRPSGRHEAMAFTLTPDREEAAERLIKRYPVPRAACIPILHLCQQQAGWVSPEAIAFVAEKLGMSTSQVQGVVTFYTSFH